MLKHNLPAGSTSPTRIAIAVVEHDGRYLIGRRPEGVPLAGLWEFPGGKVQTGETARQAAARECLEESGLEVAVGEAYPAVVHRYSHGQVALEFFACRPLDPRQTPKPPFRWVPADELGQYQFPEANGGLVDYLKSL
ncbi:MAG TPA: (deoxy)nucleoside triphosphate pyrophosphohydrolase [Pirellulales bacterium]|nr:(deoxy)nucleoside triphosphate pyrophosphohydrolase [Pirellulales bacterium]